VPCEENDFQLYLLFAREKPAGRLKEHTYQRVCGYSFILFYIVSRFARSSISAIHLSGVMGDQTRSSQSRITAVRGKLSAGSAALIQNASEIVSQRDRNYPSQSLVGNISAGWHTRKRALMCVYRLDGEGHERYWSRYRMHLSSYAPSSAAAGDCRSVVDSRAYNRHSLQRGDTYLLAWALITLLAVGYHWEREYTDRYIAPYYRNYNH